MSVVPKKGQIPNDVLEAFGQKESSGVPDEVLAAFGQSPSKKKEDFPLLYNRAKTGSMPAISGRPSYSDGLGNEKNDFTSKENIEGFRKAIQGKRILPEMATKEDIDKYAEEDAKNEIQQEIEKPENARDPFKAAINHVNNSHTQISNDPRQRQYDLNVFGNKLKLVNDIVEDGYDAKQILNTTHFGQEGDDNLTTMMLVNKGLKYEEKTKPLKDINLISAWDNKETDLSKASPEYIDENITPQLKNAAIKYGAAQNPQFAKELQAAGYDINDPMLSSKVNSFKTGEWMARMMNDKDVVAYITKENPNLLPAFQRAGQQLRVDNKDYGINAVANEVSKAIQDKGYNSIDPIFNFDNENSREYANAVAREIYANDPNSMAIYDKHIKDNQSDWLDKPSFFERFAGQAKDILKSTKQTFTSWATPVSETIKNKWDKEAHNVSAEPKGFYKWIDDLGGVAGLISTVGATGNLTGITNPATAGSVATVINFLGGEMENKKAEYPDRPVTAITHAAINTGLYAVLAQDIFPAAKVRSAFESVQPEIKKVVENFTSGKINQEIARRELSTAFKNATDFVGGTLTKTGKVSLELTGITAVNRIMDKLSGMESNQFKSIHPDDELANTFVHTLTTFAPISSLGKFGEMRQRNKLVEETIYDAVSKPLQTQRAIDKASIDLSFGTINEVKDNFNIALNAKKELDALKIHPKDQKRFIFEELKEKAAKDQAEASQSPIIQKQAKEAIRESQEIKEKILAGEDADTIVTEREQKVIDEKEENAIKLQRLQEDNDIDNKKFDADKEALVTKINSIDGRIEGMEGKNKLKTQLKELELKQERANEDYDRERLKLTPKEEPQDEEIKSNVPVQASNTDNVGGDGKTMEDVAKEKVGAMEISDEKPKTLKESYENALKLFGGIKSPDVKYSRISVRGKDGKLKEITLRVGDHAIHDFSHGKSDGYVAITFDTERKSMIPPNRGTEVFISEPKSQKEIADIIEKELAKYGDVVTDLSATNNYFSDKKKVSQYLKSREKEKTGSNASFKTPQSENQSSNIQNKSTTTSKEQTTSPKEGEKALPDIRQPQKAETIVNETKPEANTGDQQKIAELEKERDEKILKEKIPEMKDVNEVVPSRDEVKKAGENDSEKLREYKNKRAELKNRYTELKKLFECLTKA